MDKRGKMLDLIIVILHSLRIGYTLPYTNTMHYLSKHIIVNINSKYKEDDFTGSIAVDCFKMCEYTQSISAMKHTHVNLAPLFPASPSTHPSPQSG